MLEGIVRSGEERWVYWSSLIRNVCTRRFVVILLMISLSTRKVDSRHGFCSVWGYAAQAKER